MPKRTGYRAIAAHYRQQIASGGLRPGDTLPPMREAERLFGVAHATVSRAYRALKMEGLTLARTGTGTVVTGPTSSNTVARVQMYEATGRALGAGETSQILEVGTTCADELVAPRLDVTPGTPVHTRKRLVRRNGVPVHLSVSYYPAFAVAATPELTQPVSTGGSRELAAQRLGVAQDCVLEEVTSRLATDPEKEALGLSARDVIVTQVVRTVTLKDQRVVEVAVKVVGGSTVLRWTASL